MDGIIQYPLLLIITLWNVQVQGQSTREWNLGDEKRHKWSRYCDFNETTIKEVSCNEDECGRFCYQWPDCTRFTWTPDNGGLCRFKGGSEFTFYSTKNGGVCGYVETNKNISVTNARNFFPESFSVQSSNANIMHIRRMVSAG